MPVAVFADVPIPEPPSGSYSYWVVVQRSNGVIQLFTSIKPITVSKNGEQIYYGAHKIYRFSDNQWNYEFESLSDGNAPFEHMYAANHDIAYHNDTGFFFTLPKVSELYQAAKTTDFGMMWKIISAGLIPLAGLLILGISFRKAWAFLHNQLTH
jgi:hypothetical protein